MTTKSPIDDPIEEGHKPLLDVDDDRWRQIENACGVSLSHSERAGIVRATEALLALHVFEERPTMLARVRIILEAHDKAASRFFNELFTGPSVTSDAGTYAHYLIESNFKSSQTSVDELGLDGLLDTLRAFHIACNASIKQLSDPSSSSLRKAEAWKIWINRLAEVSPHIEGSHFASLVREMQTWLPPNYRHDEALAEDICDALQKK